MNQTKHSLSAGVALLAAFLAASRAAAGSPVPAVDEPWSVTTGGLAPLTSIAVPIDAPLDGLPSRIACAFGFSTLEVPAEGSFFDSLTVRLVSLDGLQAATLLTADATGPNVLPANPGGVALAPGSVRLSAIAPAGNYLANAVVSYSYRVEVDLPAPVVPGAWAVEFDVFDNGDAVPSRAFVALETVPEPPVVALLAAGAAVLALRRRA